MSFTPIAHKKKDEKIGVFVRIRPLNTKETKHQEKYAIRVEPDGLKLNLDHVKGELPSTLDKHKDSKFVYDKIFGPKITTDKIFGDDLKEIITSTLKGFNSTVFVYGQTGSGKTHTLMGQYLDFVNTAETPHLFDNPGKVGNWTVEICSDFRL